MNSLKNKRILERSFKARYNCDKRLSQQWRLDWGKKNVAGSYADSVMVLKKWYKAVYELSTSEAGSRGSLFIPSEVM
jgi:hypothetical protein